jgi:predicted deacylase
VLLDAVGDLHSFGETAEQVTHNVLLIPGFSSAMAMAVLPMQHT